MTFSFSFKDYRSTTMIEHCPWYSPTTETPTATLQIPPPQCQRTSSSKYLKPRLTHAHSKYITLDTSFSLVLTSAPTSHAPPQNCTSFADPHVRRPLRVPPIPSSNFVSTWYWTAVRYRDTSACDVVNALCRLWKFKRYLLVLGLGSLETPPAREELRGPTDRTLIATLVLSAMIDRTRTQTGRWIFRSTDQVLIPVYFQSYSAQWQ